MVENISNPASLQQAPGPAISEQGMTKPKDQSNTSANPSANPSGDSATAPKFSDILQQIQGNNPSKLEKPREIKKTLDKDDFLKIMITQMKNQDPTSPFKPEQMATELAQFTSVEQLHNVNQNLNKMATQNRPLEQLAMTNLIGKMVTIDRERLPHTQDQSDTLNFNLPKDAQQVKIAILSEKGEIAAEKELGAQKKGDVKFVWDGKNSSNLPAGNGNYMFRIEAKDEKGRSIEVNPHRQAKVIGVSFEGTEPVFLVGDAQRQDKVTIRNIIRVETDMNQQPAAEPRKPVELGNNLAGQLPNLGNQMPKLPKLDEQQISLSKGGDQR